MSIKNSLFGNDVKKNQGSNIKINLASLKQTAANKRTTNSAVKRTTSPKKPTIPKKASKFTESSYALQNTYTSFSGADAVVTILFKRGTPVVLGECQTITYSTYRPTIPVTSLGRARTKGYSYGPRTIAGTIIFTVFDRHVLVAALHKAYENVGAVGMNYTMKPDELPLFDLQVTFMNEYGQSAQLIINGVKLASEGQVMSSEDRITENTMQFLASDLQVMEPNVV